MQDIDRLIDAIVPEYENSAYEYGALFAIAKADSSRQYHLG